MSRRNVVCLAVILVTPLVASAIASVFSLAVGNLFPALPAVVVAVIVNCVVSQLVRAPARYREAAEYGSMAYAIVATYGYTALTVIIAERL